MKLNYLDYEKAKEAGYINNIEEYHVVIKAGFDDFKDMKNTIGNDSLAVNKGDGFIYVDEHKRGYLYVFDGVCTVFEAGRILHDDSNVYI